MLIALNLGRIKEFVEAGDTAGLEKLLKEQVLEAGDIKAVAAVNPALQGELTVLNNTYHAAELEQWKKTELPVVLELELAKRNPAETPEQKRIRELEEKLDKQEKESARAALKEKALEYATGKGYDGKFATKWIERFLADDETDTTATLDDFKKDFDAIVQASVEAKLKGSNRTPGGGKTDAADKSRGAIIAEQMASNNQTQELLSHFTK